MTVLLVIITIAGHKEKCTTLSESDEVNCYVVIRFLLTADFPVPKNLIARRTHGINCTVLPVTESNLSLVGKLHLPPKLGIMCRCYNCAGFMIGLFA